jgi:hypothetical protein
MADGESGTDATAAVLAAQELEDFHRLRRILVDTEYWTSRDPATITDTEAEELLRVMAESTAVIRHWINVPEEDKSRRRQD